mgnify:CR=1 FL=1
MLKIVNSWTPNPWSPAFASAPRSMGQTPLPMVSPSTVSDKVIGAGVGALVLGLTTVGVLFTYGIARDSRSIFRISRPAGARAGHRDRIRGRS